MVLQLYKQQCNMKMKKQKQRAGKQMSFQDDIFLFQCNFRRQILNFCDEIFPSRTRYSGIVYELGAIWEVLAIFADQRACTACISYIFITWWIAST